MKFVLFAIFAAMLSACASVPTDPDEYAVYKQNNDPIEPFNRVIYDFNLVADDYVLHPVIKGYRAITTPAFRKGVVNFFDNLNAPVSLTNNILQGSPEKTGITAARLVINTVAGFFGVFDVAEKLGLPKEKTSFADTLGVWGVPAGPYLVLPLLGPSDVRDASGMTADYFFNPMTYVSWNTGNKDFTRFLWTEMAVGAVAQYENAADLLADFRKNSLDSYAAVRSMYQQYRKQKIAALSGKNIQETAAPSYEFSLDEYDE